MKLEVPVRGEPEPPLFRSRFGGLWVDRRDAHEVLADRLARGEVDHDDAELLSQYIDHGYAVLPGAVSDEVIDDYLEFFEQSWDEAPATICALPPGQGAPGVAGALRQGGQGQLPPLVLPAGGGDHLPAGGAPVPHPDLRPPAGCLPVDVHAQGIPGATAHRYRPTHPHRADVDGGLVGGARGRESRTPASSSSCPGATGSRNCSTTG